jgi:hypothetical protein
VIAGNGGSVVSSPEARASRIRSYRNKRGGPSVARLMTWRTYLSGSRLNLVRIVVDLGQLVGQAGPRRLRCSIEVGAANQASTSGVEDCKDQLSAKAQGGTGTVR